MCVCRFHQHQSSHTKNQKNMTDLIFKWIKMKTIFIFSNRMIRNYFTIIYAIYLSVVPIHICISHTRSFLLFFYILLLLLWWSFDTFSELLKLWNYICCGCWTHKHSFIPRVVAINSWDLGQMYKRKMKMWSAFSPFLYFKCIQLYFTFGKK